MTINDAVYELNKATVSESQVNLTSNPGTVIHTSTHTSNGILDRNLLTCRTIGEVFVLPLMTNPTVRLTPQMLLTSVVKEIFVDATLRNARTSRTPRQISSTGVDEYIPIYTPIDRGMRESSTPASGEITGTRGTSTRITIGTTSSPYGLNRIP